MTKQLTPAQRVLVEQNYPLAKFLAGIAWNKNRQQLDLDELTSVAFEALVGAASRFDPSMVTADTLESGKAFAAFARTRINGAIIDWQRGEDHVPRSVRGDYKTLVRMGYKQGETSPAQLEAMVTGSQLTLERALQVIYAVHASPISADGMIVHEQRNMMDEASRRTTQWDISSDTESNALASIVTSGVVKTIQALPPLQQVIVALRYYSGYDLQVISTQLELSQSVVRQEHADAVTAIHAAMKRATHH